jgi:hypothetical protein
VKLTLEDFDMKYVLQMLFSTLLVTVMFFANSLPVIAASSDPTDGVVQMNEILDKTEEAIQSPATNLKTIEERSKGGLNEVQGTADYSKMTNSGDPESPVAKKAEKVLDKITGKAQNDSKMGSKSGQKQY